MTSFNIVVRLAKLVTLEERMIEKRIGTVSEPDQKRIKKAFITDNHLVHRFQCHKFMT